MTEQSPSPTQPERLEAIKQIKYNGEEPDPLKARRVAFVKEVESWTETRTLSTSSKTFTIPDGHTVFIQVGRGKFDKYIKEAGELKLLEQGTDLH